MMDHFLTTKVFKHGLTNYLNGKYVNIPITLIASSRIFILFVIITFVSQLIDFCFRAYQSAEQNDLWDALTKQARKDRVLSRDVTVKQIMDTWTLQTGFPVITVTRDYDMGSATIMQVSFPIQALHLAVFEAKVYLSRTSSLNFPRCPKDRFTIRNSTVETYPKSEPLWWVPITYTTEAVKDFSRTQPSNWLKAQRTMTLPNIDASRSQWVIFNVQQTGMSIIFKFVIYEALT